MFSMSISADERNAISKMTREEREKARQKYLVRLEQLMKEFLREESAAETSEKKSSRAKISDAERNAIMSMSDAELDALESKNNKRIGEILNTLLGKESDADTPEKKTDQQSASSAKASLSDAERNELNAILTMPKAEREKAKAKDLAEFRSIMGKLLGEESPTDTPTEKKKRTRILDGKIDHLINEEEATKRINKDEAEALRNQRMKIVEDVELGIFKKNKLGEPLYVGMKQLARNHGGGGYLPPPALLPAGPDIWTTVSGSDCYMVPYQSKLRSTSTQRRYRDKEITHGFPVKNLREFFFFSNRVVSAGYDAPNRRLYLKFDANSMYQYFNVPEDIVRGLINASSHGSYASRRICYAFKYERLPFPPPPPAVVNVVKASSSQSISPEEQDELNAILQMSDEEADAAEAKDLAEFIALGKRFLGEESPTDTPEKKTDQQIAPPAKASFTDAQRNELNAILQMSDEEADAAEAKDLAELDSLMAKLLGEESADDTTEPLRN